MQGSPDLKAAREVANYLGTLHKEFHFTVQVCSLPYAALSIRIASNFWCLYIFLVDFVNELYRVAKLVVYILNIEIGC